MQTLQVALGERSYPIHIGPGLLGQPDLLSPYIRGRQVMLVTNETVAPLYLNKVKASLSAFQVDTVILPDGEAYKTLDTVNLIFDQLLEKRHNRTTTLIALGGGVIGDMVGFAAATYQRGVDFIQIPTTLLAQVDSSVGGKTGVNHRLGKNMIGAFHQPRCVLADTAALKTLPIRELSAGIAEVIKYGLICDQSFYAWLQMHTKDLLACDDTALGYAIKRSCLAKADVVAEDEREGGIRAILNLGHTFGHAIETHEGYGSWLHGEAVAVGMLMAVDLSIRLGWLDANELEVLQRLLEQAKLPVTSPKDMTPEDFLKHMAVDKKVVDGSLRLVLLEAVGKAIVTSDFSHDALLATLKSI
ncbi:3-dehydroquinate synthase [Zooshikella sp. RANM57]|uniref:3-dehydroquinate synthase n=1 Tax=Zooshikella sp. RANM57 TaxID=3425863 RepID=UPI003D6E629D